MRQTSDFSCSLLVGTASDAASFSRLSHRLQFDSLRVAGRVLTFPCDRCGVVQLDELSELARNNYFFARNARRDYGPPIVVALESGSKTH